MTWDEGGGFWDHVAPPAGAPTTSPTAPGCRCSRSARSRGAGSSATSRWSTRRWCKFLEWNFLGDTGQLGARDALVNNMGSLLDPAKTGAVVPMH